MSAAARLRSAIRGGPLANGSFRLLTVGQFTSTVGDYCYAVALPWLVLSGHGGTVLLGIVLACYGVPRTVLIPVGGMLADKIGTRSVMLGADTVRCALVAVLAAIAVGHVASLALLAPVAALLGAGEGVFLPASLAIMPTLLDTGQLATGNALNMAAVQVGSLLGPALGGILVAAAGSGSAFAVDAASFAVSAAALALMAGRRSAATGAARGAQAAAAAPGITGVPEEVADAGDAQAAEAAEAAGAAPAGEDDMGPPAGVLALLRRARLLQVIVVVVLIANLTIGGTFEVALPALAHAHYGAPGYGALLAAFAVGQVVGTLAAARARGLRRPAAAACGVLLAGGLAMGLLPFLGGLVGAVGAIVIFGACNGFGNTLFITLLQQWAPVRLLGRVMSLVMLAAMGSFPVSVAVSGLLVHRLGPAPFFPAAAALLIVTIVGALTQRELRSFGVRRTQAAVSAR